MYTFITYNKCQCWDLTLSAVSVLITYVIYDDQLYLKGLDAYTLCTVHEQDLVVARHKRTNYIHVFA